MEQKIKADTEATFKELFEKIESLLLKGTVVMAIEGGSASGKTTLSKLLEERYGCTVFHTDDFFLRPKQRTPQRFAEPGGNMDRERFKEEILEPLKNNTAVCYRKFDCGTMRLLPPISVTPQKLTVIEGAYSMHPELSKYYDLSVFLNIDSDLQKERIEKRNSPNQAKLFFERWIPFEKEYFEKLDTAGRCDMIVNIE